MLKFRPSRSGLFEYVLLFHILQYNYSCFVVIRILSIPVIRIFRVWSPERFIHWLRARCCRLQRLHLSPIFLCSSITNFLIHLDAHHCLCCMSAHWRNPCNVFKWNSKLLINWNQMWSWIIISSFFYLTYCLRTIL